MMAEGGEPKTESKASFDMRNAALNQAKTSLNSARTSEEKAKAQAWIDKIVGKPKKMAEGGQIEDNWQSPSSANHQTKDGSVDPQDSYEQLHEGDVKHPNGSAMSEDGRKLNQHGEYEVGREGNEGFYSEGGQITDNYADTEDGDGRDMVGRIMKQRAQEYSKGGQVANDTDRAKGKSEHRDDMGSGRYDDLVNRADDMEDADYTGVNSGDELDSADENARRRDIVSRIMASRKKKDRLPNPR